MRAAGRSAIAADVILDDAAIADGVVMMAPLIGVSNRRSPVLSTETLDTTLRPRKGAKE